MKNTGKNFTRNTLFAAAAIATSLVAFQPAEAEAKVQFNFVITAPVGPGPGPGVAPGPGHVAPAPHKLSCSTVRKILHNKYGFYKIKAYDCKGKSYWYFAKFQGQGFKVKVSAFNGEIIRQIPI